MSVDFAQTQPVRRLAYFWRLDGIGARLIVFAKRSARWIIVGALVGAITIGSDPLPTPIPSESSDIGTTVPGEAPRPFRASCLITSSASRLTPMQPKRCRDRRTSSRKP
jgi:hypothetical protein